MSNPYMSEIRLVSFIFAPKGWALCNGQLLAINQNQALFSLLGTTYGGNGQTTFALPDLRGRVPVHLGQGPGLPSFVQGEKAGSETVTLQATEIPPHTHNVNVSVNPGSLPVPGNTAVPASPQNIGALTAGLYLAPRAGSTATISPSPMAPNSLSSAGGSQPHPNLMPYQTVGFIICLQGIFPSRN